MTKNYLKKSPPQPNIPDLIITEQIYDHIRPEQLFNYFIDTPEHERLKDPFQEFVQLCRTNLGWAARTIIGKGDFELLPFQVAILDTLWNKTFPVFLAGRGAGKSTLLAVYCILRAVLDQNSATGQKIVIVGPGFRQSKLLMEQIEGFFRRSPLLQACCPNPDGISRNNDKWEIQFGNSSIIAIPLGDGRRIRGIRASVIIADEFASVPEEIFNIVVRGFAAVNQNPVDKVRYNYKNAKLKKEGAVIPEDTSLGLKGNQIVRSGTADFYFNHFYKVYEQYEKIIRNKLIGLGSDQAIKDILGEDTPPDMMIDYRQYALVRLPYVALPPGYMDEAMVNESKLSMSHDEFRMEYMAEFITDSNGFFKASAIDNATPRMDDPMYFQIETCGESSAQYVMGLDPARKSDMFALCLLKVGTHVNKVVYLQQWDKKNFAGIATEIRMLCRLFNVRRIGIDMGGGGTAIVDFLQTPELIPEGELPFFEIDSTKVLPGLKIIDPINYMGGWLKTANYDLVADIEHRRIIFPYSVNTGGTTIKDVEKADEIFDLVKTLKKQLISIQISATDKSEIEHFDVAPEMKWKSHKDLYSALLIAAYEGRQIKQGEVRKVKMGADSIGGSIDEFA